MKQLIIDLKKNGEVNIEADGFQGAGCVESAKGILAALGMKDDEPLQVKQEFFQEEGVTNG